MERDISVLPTEMTRQVKEDHLKAGPEHFGRTKPKWLVPFDVPAEISSSPSLFFSLSFAGLSSIFSFSLSFSLDPDTDTETISTFRFCLYWLFRRVSMGWWHLRLSAKILALLRLSVKFFQLRLTKS